MRRIAVMVVSVIAAVFMGGVTPAPAGAAGPAGTEWWQSGDAQQLTVELNAQRNWYGRPTLPADGVLSYWAEVHASLMAQAGRVYHQDLGAIARATGCNALAENVTASPTVWDAHVTFSYSPPHLNNSVGNWRLVGVGVASRHGQKWVVELFCSW